MSDQELARKFDACTAGVFAGEFARAFLDAAASLERMADVGRIVDHIRLSRGEPPGRAFRDHALAAAAALAVALCTGARADKLCCAWVGRPGVRSYGRKLVTA